MSVSHILYEIKKDLNWWPLTYNRITENYPTTIPVKKEFYTNPKFPKMDESLDEYISKSNFKIKIGNPKPTGFQGKRRATPGFQGNKVVTDVSITVPAVRKTGPNNNKTNQMRDARERLVSKNKPLDAREKLNQKAQNTDARQKLLTIRSQKEPQDARAKIQAKKQQQAQNQTQTQSGPFNLTRTVSNNKNNSIQLTPGPQGNINITKTLTKVMPPGYEHIIGPSTNVATKGTTRIGTSAVKNRLGPPSSTNTGIKPVANTCIGTSISLRAPPRPDNTIPNITRTISNPHTIGQGQQQQQYSHLSQTSPAPLSYEIHSLGSTHAASHIESPHVNTVQSMYQNAPPQHLQPANQTAPYPYPPQQTLPTYPPSQPIPVQQAPTGQGPPYPINDPLPGGSQYSVGHHPSAMPKIQVQNDQYRPPEPPYPQYAAPPQQQYAPPPQHYAPPVQQQYAPPQQPYMYPPAQQPVMYEPTPQGAYHQPQSRLSGDTNSSVFQRTIVNDAPPLQQSVSQTLPVKRRSTGELVEHSSSSGPLRSSSKNYVPIIPAPSRSETSRVQKPKFSKITAPGEPTAKKIKEEDDENVISPLQGYKIAITNLAHSVTQDDIIELFGAIGAIKSVKMLKLGTAEVVYVKKDNASEAAKTYHERELDGLPMVVKLVTPVSARIKEVPDKLPPSMKPLGSSPLRFSKPPVGKTKAPDKKEVDVTTLHKALFKSGSSGPSKPVTFTVNI